jgi:hypothetical protein
MAQSSWHPSGMPLVFFFFPVVALADSRYHRLQIRYPFGIEMQRSEAPSLGSEGSLHGVRFLRAARVRVMNGPDHPNGGRLPVRGSRRPPGDGLGDYSDLNVGLR